MKKLSALLLFITLFYSAIAQQTGKVFDNLTVKSKILGMERKYAVYLPPGYETSQRSYPVLYLLHGAGDDQTGWVQFGEVNNIADKAINEGSATAMTHWPEGLCQNTLGSRKSRFCRSMTGFPA